MPNAVADALHDEHGHGHRLELGQPRRARLGGVAWGGCSGKARQTTPAAPVAAAVRHATRAPDERPPVITRQAWSGPPPRSLASTAVHASSRCGAAAADLRPADPVGLLHQRDSTRPGGAPPRRRPAGRAPSPSRRRRGRARARRGPRPRAAAGGRGRGRAGCDLDGVGLHSGQGGHDAVDVVLVVVEVEADRGPRRRGRRPSRRRARGAPAHRPRGHDDGGVRRRQAERRARAGQRGRRARARRGQAGEQLEGRRRADPAQPGGRESRRRASPASRNGSP